MTAPVQSHRKFHFQKSVDMCCRIGAVRKYQEDVLAGVVGQIAKTVLRAPGLES